MNAKKVVDLADERALRTFLKHASTAFSLIKHYRLTPDHEVETCDMWQWSDWMCNFDNRRVAETMVDGARVSTVFLGLDHNFWGSGPPILFETMVFPDPESGHDLDMDRYATWDEAVAGHADMVRKFREKVVRFRRRK